MLARRICALMALGLIAGPAFGGTINEVELAGSPQSNSLRATAQGLSPASFTANNNPNVYSAYFTATVHGHGGNGDIDFYSFESSAGVAHFDIDVTPEGRDYALALFDANGTLAGYADDTGPTADAGSATTLDPFLGEINLAEGAYYIAVIASGNFPSSFQNAGTSGLTRPDGGNGGFEVFGASDGDSSFTTDAGTTSGSDPYDLHISLENGPNPVPEPSTAFLLPMIFLARRQRRS